MTRHTNLAELRKHIITAPFTWGEPIRLYEVGPYSILEFHPWERKNGSISTGQPDKDSIEFHGWVDNRDTCMGFNTLDDALAGLICYRHDGPNSQAARYFMRGLNQV
jgi:hypothetical protein